PWPWRRSARVKARSGRPQSDWAASGAQPRPQSSTPEAMGSDCWLPSSPPPLPDIWDGKPCWCWRASSASPEQLCGGGSIRPRPLMTCRIEKGGVEGSDALWCNGCSSNEQIVTTHRAAWISGGYQISQARIDFRRSARERGDWHVRCMVRKVL